MKTKAALTMLLIAFLISACATAAVPPTATTTPSVPPFIASTPTGTPLATETPLPTDTSTLAPSPTPEGPQKPDFEWTEGLGKIYAQVKDVGSLDNLNSLYSYLSSPAQMQDPVVSTTQHAGFGLHELGQTFEVFQCNYNGEKTCAVIATARIGDHLFVIMQIATVSGPANQLLYLGNSSSGREQEAAQAKLDKLNNLNEFDLNIVLQLNNLDLTNLYIYTMTPGPGDTLSEGALQLEQGLITDGKTLRWGVVGPRQS